MFDDFLGAIADPGFEEYGEVILESVEWQDLAVTLLISANFKDESLGRWRVFCSSVRNVNVVNEQRRTILQLSTEHILLWPHIRPSRQLYYSGHIANPAAAMGDIWEAHRKLVGAWFSFDHFMNQLPPHLKYLDGGSGMFAQGPVELIEEYARVLRLHGFVVSLLPPALPGCWIGAKWIPEPSPMYVLLLGKSFIIAPQIDVTPRE